MPTGYRSITIDDSEGKAAYELKLATSGEEVGTVLIEQKKLSMFPPSVSLQELTTAVAWLNGEANG